ncbi:hypothetical protein GCM10009841_17530 [Microlunatus panaciterrae]|uniref:DNA-binding MarR family transcriptional regulator n=1 Tax=Microlunatus panaciterrae TaxID=400768 RepID=A0ABS2RMV9_9ACTN|nr:hypothetical protein [Microlunatus panaciterrae]MBM7800312.1 DNA-binding MarR family transcriptional regulator [Microlunatus panaciterrae]
MMRSKKTTAAAITGGLLALGAGIGVAGLASADPTTTPSATSSSSAAPDRRTDRPGRFHGEHGQRQDDLARSLADKLGVTEAKVTAALRAIRDENRPTAPPSAGTDRPTPAARDAALAKQLAAKLGIPEAKVKAALDQIRTAAQAERAAALKSRLDAAVKAGTLTRAEADAVTKAVQKGVIEVGGPR